MTPSLPSTSPRNRSAGVALGLSASDVGLDGGGLSAAQWADSAAFPTLFLFGPRSVAAVPLVAFGPLAAGYFDPHASPQAIGENIPARVLDTAGAAQ